MKAPKIVFAGGGTGGHVYPNLAIYEGLKKQYPDARFMYLGTRQGAEYRILTSLGRPMEIQTIPAIGFPMQMKSLKTLWALAILLLGAIKALLILGRFRPQLVVATGGYVSAPTLLAAYWLRIPIFIHEQNSVPGRLNLIMARFAKRIGVSFQDTPGFPPAKTVYVGYPIRANIVSQDSRLIKEKLQIPQHNKVVFIFGGSGGAQTINTAAGEIIPMLLANPKITIIWGTGRGYGTSYAAFEESTRCLKGCGIEPDLPGRLIVREYFDKIEEIYAISDLIVCRAGAGTIKEIQHTGIPSLIIPKINLPGDHQIRNALAIEKMGGALVIQEQIRTSALHGRQVVVDETELYSRIINLIEDPFQLGEMRRRLRSQEKEDSVSLIVSELEKMILPVLEKTQDRTVEVFYLQRQDSDDLVELIFDTTTFGRSPLLDVVLLEATSPVRFNLNTSAFLSEITLLPLKGQIRVNGNLVGGKTLIKEGDRIQAAGYDYILKSYREKIADMPVTGHSRRRMIGSSIGKVISRFGGFLRDVVMAAFFGASRFTDIYWAALTITNFTRRLVAKTALENVFMPIYLRLYRRVGHERTWNASSSILNFSILMSLIFVLIGLAFTPQIVDAFYPGFVNKGMLREAVTMFRIMFPYLILISMTGIMTTILKAHGRFGISEAASIFFSVASIMVVVLFNKSAGFYSLGIAVLVGGFLQVLALIPFFWSLFRGKRTGIGYRPILHLASAPNKKYYSQLLPIGGDVVLSKTSELVDQFLASTQIDGAISILSYAKQVFRLPLVIISQAANTVLLRNFGDNLAGNERDRASRLFLEGIKINLFILIPVSILMVVLALPMVAVIYQRHAFLSDNALFTARALQLYGIGLIGWGLHALTGRVFAARLDLRISMIINAVMLAVNIVLCLFLVKTSLGYLGLALATSLSYLVFAVIRIYILVRCMRTEGTDFDSHETFNSLWKTGLASLLMVVMLLAIRNLFSIITIGSSWVGQLVILISSGFIGISVYILCSLLLNNTEILIFRKRHRQRIEQIPAELLPPGSFLERVSKKPEQFATEFAYKTTVFLSSSSWNVRNMGIKLIGLFNQKDKVSLLLAIISERVENGFVRRNAVKSLHQLKMWDDRIKETLIYALSDPYYEVRVATYALLADSLNADDPVVVDVLKGLGKKLRQKGVEEQRIMIHLLSMIGRKEQIPWIEIFLTHSNSLLRESLLKAYISFYKRQIIDKRKLEDCLERVLMTSNNMQPTFHLKEIMIEIQRILS